MKLPHAINTWILDGLEVTLADLMPRAALDAAAALVATLLAWRRAAL